MALAAGKTRSKGTLKAQIPTQNQIAEMENRAVEKINSIRINEGLAPLKLWKELANCARGHSQNMAIGKVGFGHEGFDQRAEAMNQYVQLSSFGENVAYTYLHKDPVSESVSGWMESPPHRKNILGDFKETGIGIAYSKEGKCYLTQLFAKRMRP